MDPTNNINQATPAVTGLPGSANLPPVPPSYIT